MGDLLLCMAILFPTSHHTNSLITSTTADIANSTPKNSRSVRSGRREAIFCPRIAPKTAPTMTAHATTKFTLPDTACEIAAGVAKQSTA